MSKSFLRGMSAAINLFPAERDIEITIPTYSDQEAFIKDLEQVSLDINSAIKSIEQSKDFRNHKDNKENGTKR